MLCACVIEITTKKLEQDEEKANTHTKNMFFKVNRATVPRYSWMEDFAVAVVVVYNCIESMLQQLFSRSISRQ